MDGLPVVLQVIHCPTILNNITNKCCLLGTAGDSFSSNRYMAFTTKDRENSRNYDCAKSYQGAWWYWYCGYSNLNGRYYHGGHSPSLTGIFWYKWKGFQYSAKRAEMKIRPV